LEQLRVNLTEFERAQQAGRYSDDVRRSAVAIALAGSTYPGFFGDAEVVYDDPGKGLGKPTEVFTSMADLMKPHMNNVKRELV
jgi:hypothetical protein